MYLSIFIIVRYLPIELQDYRKLFVVFYRHVELKNSIFFYLPSKLYLVNNTYNTELSR